MKRILCILLALTLCMSFCACGQNTEEPKPSETQPEAPVETLEANGYIEAVYDDYVVVKVFHDIEGKETESFRVNLKNGEKYHKYAYVTIKYTEIKRSENKEELPVMTVVSMEEHIATVEKPIIYFYPETEVECTVSLDFNGQLTCTYPAYKDEWKFTAKPDGTLVFPDGKEYYALYWEGTSTAMWDLSNGFCVKGEDTAEFLEWALAAQGLNAREANEFIVYWLPLMQGNAYNVISFQTDVYTQVAELKISPAPDSMLRVFMTYYASDEPVEIAAQEFTPFERTGFTVVEWGGSKIQ